MLFWFDSCDGLKAVKSVNISDRGCTEFIVFHK